MSVLTASSIVFTNLLSELNLNPEWEKWRGYFFTGSIVCSLFPFYMTWKGIDLHCVPVRYSRINENMSLDCTDIANEIFSLSQTNFVNSQCAGDGIVRWQRYVGAIMLGITILILFVSSFWLQVEVVRDGIKTFSEAGDKLLQLVLSQHEIMVLCSKPLKSDDTDISVYEYVLQEDGYELKSHKAVREFMRFCSNHAPKSTILAWYLLRNIALMLVMVIASGVAIWAWIIPDHWKQVSVCRMTESAEIPLSELICITNSAIAIRMFVGLYLVTLVIQIIMIVYGIYKCYKCCKSFEALLMCLSITFCGSCRHGNPSEVIAMRLLAEFWESASSAQSGLLKYIVNHIYSSELKKNLSDNMETICRNKDYKLIRMNARLFGSSQEVIYVVYKLFAQRSPMLDVEECTKLLQAACDTESDIIRIMYENNIVMNELIVLILQDDDLQDDIENIQSIVNQIQLDRIEDKSRNSVGEKRSILFYAFSAEYVLGDQRNPAAATALCRRKYESNLKIYETRISKNGDRKFEERTLLRYLKDIYPENGEVEKILNKCGIVRQIPPSAPSHLLIDIETSL